MDGLTAGRRSKFSDDAARRGRDIDARQTRKRPEEKPRPATAAAPATTSGKPSRPKARKVSAGAWHRAAKRRQNFETAFINVPSSRVKAPKPAVVPEVGRKKAGRARACSFLET